MGHLVFDGCHVSLPGPAAALPPAGPGLAAARWYAHSIPVRIGRCRSRLANAWPATAWPAPVVKDVVLQRGGEGLKFAGDDEGLAPVRWWARISRTTARERRAVLALCPAIRDDRSRLRGRTLGKAPGGAGASSAGVMAGWWDGYRPRE